MRKYLEMCNVGLHRFLGNILEFLISIKRSLKSSTSSKINDGSYDLRALRVLRILKTLRILRAPHSEQSLRILRVSTKSIRVEQKGTHGHLNHDGNIQHMITEYVQYSESQPYSG